MTLFDLHVYALSCRCSDCCRRRCRRRHRRRRQRRRRRRWRLSLKKVLVTI